MAFNVSYIFKAVDKFSAKARRIERAQERVNKRFKKSDGILGRTGKRFSSISNLARKIPGPLKAIAAAFLGFTAIRSAIRKFTQFEDRLRELQAITGASGRDLKFLQNSAFELGKEFARSGEETLEAFKLVASAKPELLENIPALKETTREVLKLSAAAGIDLSTSSRFAAQALNIFGAGSQEAARFVNVLAAGAKFGSSEIAETGEALLIAGPGAKAAGLSFEQLNAAIQTTALGGIKAQRAGTALNAIFLRLQNQGIDFQKLGLQGSFEIIKEKMDSLEDSTARAQFATKLFGMEHAKVGLAILENVGELSKFERKLTGTNVAQEQANIRLSTMSARFKKLGTAFDEKIIKLMAKLAPIGMKVADVVQRMIGYFDKDALEGFAAAMKVLGIAMIPILETLELIVFLLAKFFAMLSKGGKLIGLFGAKLAMGNKVDFGEEAGKIFAEERNLFGFTKGMIQGRQDIVGGSMDINIRDKGQNVESTQVRERGDLDLNVGSVMG